ncbi:MAG: LptF/LptG family permease [Ignavibacteria bacterium]
MIYKYILKAHIAPFFLSFFIIIFVFTFQFIMKFIDNLIGKGLSWWIIFQLIVLNLAWMVTLAGPMAVLVATLTAFGSLSSSNEITVIKSSGMSLFRMILPVLLVSGLLCYGLILFNNKVLPEANHRTKVLMSDIQRTRPTFVIEPGRFTDDISGYNLLVRKTFTESNKLEGIFIIDNSNPNFSNILTADRGEITFSKDFSKFILDLYDGEIHQLSKKNMIVDYRKINFEKHVVNIDAQGFGFSKSEENVLSRGDRELSADSMRNIVKKIQNDYQKNYNNIIDSVLSLALGFSRIDYKLNSPGSTADSVYKNQIILKAQNLLLSLSQYKSQVANQKQIKAYNQKQVDMYLVEIYKKYSIPFACIVFVLVGAPLGVRIRKGGFGVASGMSLGFFLLYWASLIGGEKLADREIISPLIGMWTANIILGIIGLYFVFSEIIDWKKLSLRKIKNND